MYDWREFDQWLFGYYPNIPRYSRVTEHLPVIVFLLPLSNFFMITTSFLSFVEACTSVVFNCRSMYKCCVQLR